MSKTLTISKTRYRLQQFKKVLVQIFSSKRGAFGIIILVAAAIIALAAPLIAPYDPVNDKDLAGRFCAPIWYPKIFGGAYSENMELVDDPLFDSPKELQYWHASPSGSVQVSWVNFTGYNKDLNGRLYNKPGCILLNLTEPSDQNLTAVYSLSFNYSYTAPPKRFRLSFYYLAKAVENSPVNVTVRLYQPGNKPPLVILDSYKESGRLIAHIDETSKSWTLLKVDSQAGGAWREEYLGENVQTPARYMFPRSGVYKIEVEIKFTPNANLEPGRVMFLIDNFRIKLYGSVFGLLGTDQEGRDIFSQLIWGSRLSLFVGVLCAIVSVALGLIFGLLAGYIGGAVDEIIMRMTDVLLTIPGLPLLIVLMAVLGASLFNLIILIGFLGWMGFARTVRSMVLSLKERPFVEAARAAGASTGYILVRHIIPNVMTLVYVALATSVPGAILAEAALSFLGLYDPNVMTWGRMLHDVETSPVGVKMWWWAVPPGMGIAIVSLSFILMGYALDEILNPRLRERR